MAVDDRTRLNLHRKLEAVLGPEEADTLMAHLPIVTWHDVATKDDLRVLGAEIRGELRAEMSDVRTELRTGLADVRTELSQAMERQIRWMVSFNTALAAIALAAARLLF